MTKRLSASFDQHFNVGQNTDVAALPANYNDTKTEIITTAGGQRFIKKKTVIKKGGPGSQIFITSTSYVPVDETENMEPGSEVEGQPPVSSSTEAQA